MSIKKRVKELERKSRFYDEVAMEVALEKDMDKEFDEISNKYRFEELEKNVGAAKDTHTRNIIVTLGCFFLISLLGLYFHLRALKEI